MKRKWEKVVDEKDEIKVTKIVEKAKNCFSMGSKNENNMKNVKKYKKVMNR